MPVETAIQKTTVSIRVISDKSGKLSLGAAIPDQFLCAGMATFVIEEDGSLVCDLLHVEEKCRRRGIASALFDFAENHFQQTAVSGLQLTPDSIEFYKARGIAIPANVQIKSFNEWFDAV